MTSMQGQGVAPVSESPNLGELLVELAGSDLSALEGPLKILAAFQRLLKSGLNLETLVQLTRDGTSFADLIQFKEEPYFIYGKSPDGIKIAVPKFEKGFHPGWLIGETPTFRLYELSTWTRWLGLQWPNKFPIPPEIQAMLSKPQIPVQFEDDRLIIPEEHKGTLEGALRKEHAAQHILSASPEEGSYHIKPGHQFELLAALIDQGFLPYVPNPVDRSLLREPVVNFQLKPYEQNAHEEFLRRGAVGVYWPPGKGKTYLGLYELACLEGRKLVLVPTLTLKEQWRERISSLTGVDQSEVDIAVYGSHTYKKFSNNHYSLVIFDESHMLPADTFSSLATINAKYRLGLTASPYREDGRTSYIFALTGFPIGVDWNQFQKMGLLQFPELTVYVLKDEEAKIRKLGELLEERVDGKQLIFSDSISLGQRVADQFSMPFIYGETKNRMDVLRSHDRVAVSRVVDLGVSLEDIARVIEIAYLKGSRRQELQRYGRLMHADAEHQGKGSHIALMTLGEYERYRKRFWSVIERGVHLNVIYLN